MKPIKKGERAKLARRLSKKITNVLDVYNISQADLAHDMHIHPTTFNGWVKGTNCPKHRDLYNEVMAYLDATYIKQDVPPDPQLGLNLTPEPEPSTGIAERSALNVQVGGDHYKTSKIQPIEYIEANDLTFLEGSIVKRITRHGKPTGKGREDIEKVIHEAQLILEMRYGSE